MSNAALACLLAQQQAGGVSCRGMPSNQRSCSAAQPPDARDSLLCRSKDGRGPAAATMGGLGPVKGLQAGRSGAQASPKAPGSVMSLVKGLQALQRPIHRPRPPGALDMSLSSNCLPETMTGPPSGQIWSSAGSCKACSQSAPYTKEGQLQKNCQGGSSCLASF